MSYDGERAYLGTFSLAAANVIGTASGQVVAATTTLNCPIPEATFLCSIAAFVTATPTAPPAGVKPFIVSGTTTTTGSTALTVSSASFAQNTFIPNVSVASGALSIGLVQTSTVSGTMTAPGVLLVLSFAPQYT